MKALTFTEFGNSDVLEYRDMPVPKLKPGEILVATKAIGINYADIMRRKGIYPLRDHVPHVNGYESAGIVTDNNHHPDIKI